MSSTIEFNLEYIIKEYSNYLYKIIDNIVKDTLSYQDKEEILADTFYLLWKNQAQINTNLKAYLSTIARNCAYDRLRSHHLTTPLNEVQNGSYISHLDELILIKEKLKKLSKDEKILFELFYLSGYKVKEIAKQLHKSNSDIKIRLFRLRKKLKEELK